MAFQYGRELQEPVAARRLEFLMTGGHGYSSSTVGGNTRKYHGLLVAALNPPGTRTVCLSKLDEDLIFGKDVFRVLKESGSFVLDLGGAYRSGIPSRSLYNFRVMLALCDEIG